MSESTDLRETSDDFVALARDLTPVEAHLLRALLQTADIPARADDVNMVQAYSLIAPALGGASVCVPTSQLKRAQSVLDAYRRGAFALDEGVDVGDKGG